MRVGTEGPLSAVLPNPNEWGQFGRATRGTLLGLNWLRLPTQDPTLDALALFHSMWDMMTVIMRIDRPANSGATHQAKSTMTSLSHLVSVHLQLTGTGPTIWIVWQMGCLTVCCEGLRVLGTWIKPGWGLGVPEIGRTGIFSPRNNYRRIRRTTA